MAEVTLPTSSARTSWLDRPAVPAAEWLSSVAVNWELVAYASIVLIGFVLRIWDVGGRALHHDESLHAYYSWLLYTGHGYRYAPMMHGPFQFEVVPLFYLLFGASEFSARLLAVVLGTVLIFLPYFLRSYLTRPGALLASGMLAISPAFVYFSRFIRDDIYLACFSLILFIALVRYLESPRPHYLYIAAAAMALAMASMEAAYLTFFIFGTFLIFAALQERVSGRPGPVYAAWKTTSIDTWLTAIAIFVVLTVLMYSTFFTNPYGIWDTQHSLCLQRCFSLHPVWNTDRSDILGGITYWLAQHDVQRGAQPWFYYLLVLPLYEQLAVLFGVAGLMYGMVRRSFVTTFLVWWAVLSLLLYSWAGEKMPWLVIHIALPFILLAGLFVGAVVHSRRLYPLIAVGVSFLALLALEIHSTFVLNYVDGANPTEMLVYVQTSQDVPNTVHEIARLSQRLTGGTGLQIGLDSNDVGGWPFTWYLRDYPNVTQTASFSGPVCNGQYCPVLLMLGPEFDQSSPQLMKHYVAQKYRWNWWFPEDYKQWFPEHWGAALQGNGSVIANLLGTSTDWNHIWDWLVYRRPFGDRGARWLYVLVRRDLVPGSKQYSTTAPVAPVSVPQVSIPSLHASVAAVLGSTGVGKGQLDGPRGLASAPNGNVYVADTLNHRIAEFTSSGVALRSWGQVGTAPGQFSPNSSPQSLGIGPNGTVYVADTWNQRIQAFTPQGRFLRQWGGGPIGSAPGQFYGPRSIAIAPDGRVYVADTGNKRIQVFTGSGRYLFSIGSAGGGPGQFQEPSSIAIGPSGTLYVADFWNQRIQALTLSGTYLRSWPVTDWTPRSYDEPYLAVDPSTSNVFATDPQQQRVLEFTATGRAIGSFGTSQLSVPIGVAALPDGRIAVSDATANHVEVFAVRPPSPGQKRQQSRQLTAVKSQEPKKP